MNDLIRRLKEATGPDRELDAEIDVLFLGGETVWNQANYTMEAYPSSKRVSSCHVGGYAFEHVPLYTASIDDSISLVGQMLPGQAIMIRVKGSGPEDVNYASIGAMSSAEASTPSLAILAALCTAPDLKDGNAVQNSDKMQ